MMPSLSFLNKLTSSTLKFRSAIVSAFISFFAPLYLVLCATYFFIIFDWIYGYRVSRKYGHDHVSQIITFGTMAAKMVIRDVARVLDYPYSEADKLAKMIPNEIHITIPKALEQNRELKELYDKRRNL